MKKIIKFIKRESVLSISFLLAVLSMFVILPDAEYITYIDYKTLGLLFCLMTIMAGYQKMGIFKVIGEALLKRVNGSRGVAAILIFLCFLTSMFITNDVALITFVPLALTVLSMAKLEQFIVPVVVLQTIAANLGSMMMPFGNPQNLYLYSKADIGMMEFIKIILPYGVFSFLLLVLSMFFIKKEEIKLTGLGEQKEDFHIGKISIYSILFLLSIGAVAHLISWKIVLVLVVVIVFFMDRKVFVKVDYSLLFTFVFFFLFIGNLGRIPAFCQMLQNIIQGNETITAVLASQVISNVPAALLLSGFTDNWGALIIGTNLGGLGTLIASMASLISYKQIAQNQPKYKKSYFGWFTIVNVIYLLLLIVLHKIL